MSDDVFTIDKAQARRAFERAAESYDAAAGLQQEVGERLIERLDYIRLDPARILDAGCGTGGVTERVHQRYPRAQVVGLDLAWSMVRRARRRGRWRRRPQGVCGDVEALPLADDSMDLVFSNLTLQWAGSLDQAFGELARVLRPGGLLLFTTFGPDTLHELRAAWAAVDHYNHVNAFMDMHDVGDALVRAGFADPVMDVDRLAMRYPRLTDLMRDLKAIGAHNVTEGRPRGLTGRRRLAALERAYGLDGDGRLPATYEVVYGHAWGRVPHQGPTDDGQVAHFPVADLYRRRSGS